MSEVKKVINENKFYYNFSSRNEKRNNLDLNYLCAEKSPEIPSPITTQVGNPKIFKVSTPETLEFPFKFKSDTVKFFRLKAG